MIDRSTRLVVARELREATRRKSLWALVGLIFLGSTGIVFVPWLLSGDGDAARVAVAGEGRDEVVETLNALDDPELDAVATTEHHDTLATAVTDGDLDAAVVLGGDDGTATPTVITEEEDGVAAAVVNAVADHVVGLRLADRGIDRTEVAAAFADAVPAVELVGVDDDEGREAAAFAVTFVMYLLIVMLSNGVAQGVALEKSSRVSEVLLAIIPARSLLYGKVIGVSLVGLLTLTAGAIPPVARLLIDDGLPEGLGVTLAVSAAWCVLGLILYLIVAGVLGALVDRQEDVGAVIGPLTMMLVLVYLAALTIGESAAGTVLSLVPLFSPVIVPARIAVGAGAWPEYVVSFVLLVAGVALAGRFGAVVFRRAVTRTGRRLGLREVLRSRQ